MIGVFLLMLCCPKEVFNGASEGLLLWFQILFPTLFPFLLITDLLMATGGIRMISKVLSVPFGILFRVSGEGSFAVVAGFLCGYPMGAKITADLIRNQSISVEEGTYLLSFCNNTSPIFIMNFLVWKTLDRKELLLPSLVILLGTITADLIRNQSISVEEGTYLLSFCNNTSPIFIMNFLVWKTLDRKELLLPSLVILLGTPVVMSFPFRKIYKSGRKRGGGRNTLGMQRNYIMKKKSVESCMMDSFETIVKVGGYLIIFSVLLELAEQTGQKNIAATLLLSTLEVTNGILMIAKRFPEISTAYPLLIGLTSMGGICSMAQTQSMIRGTGLKLSDYIIQKLATAMAASGFAILYAKFNF